MINVAIIGTGNISASHIKGYLTFPERCRIVALVDIYPEKAEKRRQEFAPDAKVYSSHKDILDRKDISLVSVCTPPFTHAEIAIDCLKAGKDVLLEKPMASSLEECDAILKAVEESGRTLSAVAQNRFKTPVMNLKHVLDSGLAGEMVHAQVDSYWWRGHCYYDLWWRGTWQKESGGCTLNHAVHHIDMLSWMAGLPDSITAIMANTSHDNAEVEDLSVAILRYGKGALGQITSSVVHHGEEQQVVFQCKNARVSAPWKVYASKSKPNGFPEEDTELKDKLNKFHDSLPTLKYEGHTGQIDNLLTALETGGKPLITGEDGRRTLEIITAIYKSGSTGQEVKLPLDKKDPFYTSEGMIKNAVHFYEKKTAVENFKDDKITTGSSYK